MIEKRTWMPFYQLMVEGKKKVEVRIADFELHEGDEILFREWNQTERRYTGRQFKKKVKFLCHVNFAEFNTIDEILECGHYVMELEDVRLNEGAKE